jgi:Skp family chaperone for outer membrane proteins
VKFRLLPAFAAALIALAAQTSHGQDNQPAAAGPGVVAVLDVFRVFNENAEHSAAMEQIRQSAEAVKASVEGEMQTISSEAQQVMKLEAGSPERNQKEADLEQRQTALRTRARQEELDLLAREAGVYYQTWTRMQQVITAVAEHNNISLVLRFDSAAIDPENRGDVIKGVNRAVIYHDRLDMTDLVIQQMGPTTAQAPPTTQNR